MRVAVMEAPDGLVAGSSEWERLKQSVREAQPDMLVTNEMPFGPWLAAGDAFDPDAAAASAAHHETGMLALSELGVPVVLSSRPVLLGDRLANEAFSLVGGTYHSVHH